MHIVTHRGLDAQTHHAFTESSKEAFTHFLNEGFGVEFDIRITEDGIPVISHDASLDRLTGSSVPDIADMTADTFLQTSLPTGSTLTFDELIDLMHAVPDNTSCLHALHLKHNNQTQAELDILIPYLSKITDLPLILFDATPEFAQKLKTQVPKLSLAASVAHPFDIIRYNEAVGGTLVSVADMAKYTDLYDWVWLDEWDRTDQDGSKKALYTKETFTELRALGYKIALVSPELHGTSPKLLGGESHQDAADISTLTARWDELIALQPDAICTDHPYRFKDLLS